jgi:hypothetical protein|tara:strand:- start:8267 stop:8464 length:198 start_codon:yes stop_codon:yes gene_type:complete
MSINNTNSISDTELVKFYKRMIAKGKIKPDGSGFNRMIQIKKRILTRKYKKFLKSFGKGSNGIAI